MNSLSQEQINADLFDECKRLQSRCATLAGLVRELLDRADTMKIKERQKLSNRCRKALRIIK